MTRLIMSSTVSTTCLQHKHTNKFSFLFTIIGGHIPSRSKSKRGTPHEPSLLIHSRPFLHHNKQTGSPNWDTSNSRRPVLISLWRATTNSWQTKDPWPTSEHLHRKPISTTYQPIATILVLQFNHPRSTCCTSNHP